MSVLAALIAAGAVVAAPDPLFLAAEALVEGEIVRLADIADLAPLPDALRARAAVLPVARLRAEEQTLSSRAVAARARAALPALSAWLPSAPDRPIRVTAVRATPAANVQGRSASAPEAPAVRAGDPLAVRVRVGPVTVEREVRALQPGRPGRPLFVRTPEGAVLTARLADVR